MKKFVITALFLSLTALPAVQATAQALSVSDTVAQIENIPEPSEMDDNTTNDGQEAVSAQDADAVAQIEALEPVDLQQQPKDTGTEKDS